MVMYFDKGFLSPFPFNFVWLLFNPLNPKTHGPWICDIFLYYLFDPFPLLHQINGSCFGLRSLHFSEFTGYLLTIVLDLTGAFKIFIILSFTRLFFWLLSHHTRDITPTCMCILQTLASPSSFSLLCVGISQGLGLGPLLFL